MSTFFSDWYYLSIRSTKQIWRPLMALIPSLFIPIFFFLVNAASLQSFSNVEGFPAGVSYRDFIAPTALFTAVFFSSGNAGIELVQDIANGYFKKLLIMPINRLSIVLGRLTEVAVQAVMQGSIVLVLLLAVGVRFKTGVFGIFAIFGLLILFAMAWSCVGMISALRTQNARLVQSLFVLVFPFLYLTTSQAPMNLLPPTFQVLARFNPITYVIEGVRALVLSDWSNPAIWQGYLIAGILFAVMVTLTLGSFRKALK
ncbi:MAG: ABC transporter permease [Chlorobia bacterium]|nr:ABC transporter permease [Fimbriimonadaceae bacterium]